VLGRQRQPVEMRRDHRLAADEVLDRNVGGVATVTMRHGVSLGRLVDAGAQAVVLGCTELELLLGPDDCAVPLLPSARLHVEAAVAAALDG